MTKSFYILAIGILLSLECFGQDSINVSKYQPQSFSIDFNDNIFLISGDVLYKLDNKFNQETFFSNKMYGEISSVDVSNPFKILVFYKETGMLVFLDNHLKEIQTPISLPKQGLVNTELACTGSNNSFWIYYNDTHQIIKFDYKINAIASTPDLSILTDVTIQPKSICEKGDKLFLEIPDWGILIFYNTGNYLQTLHLPKFSSFEPISESSFFYVENMKESKIYNFAINNSQKLGIKGLYSTDNQMLYYDNAVYELKGNTILIRKIDIEKTQN